MSTGEKERRVINRAVRVLDEIESRIHELREELEQGGASTGKGRRSQRNETTEEATEHETADGGRAKSPEADRRSKASKAEHENGSDGHNGDDEHEPHAQGKVKHPETDKRLKNNKEDHEEGDEHQATHAGDEHEPHAQGKVKHPESDKRLKSNKD